MNSHVRAMFRAVAMSSSVVAALYVHAQCEEKASTRIEGVPCSYPCNNEGCHYAECSPGIYACEDGADLCVTKDNVTVVCFEYAGHCEQVGEEQECECSADDVEVNIYYNRTIKQTQPCPPAG